MKNISHLALICALLFTTAAVAREKTGNGGLAVVCRNAKTNAIESAEILDIFEAKYRYGLTPAKTDEFFFWTQRNYTKARNRIAILVPEFFKILVKHELKVPRKSFVSSEFILTETEDTGSIPVMKKGCALEQAAVLTTEEDAFIVSEEIWDTLDELNRSALQMHETIYLIDRKYNQADSSHFTRKVTAHLMSDIDDINVDTKITDWLTERFHLGKP